MTFKRDYVLWTRSANGNFTKLIGGVLVTVFQSGPWWYSVWRDHDGTHYSQEGYTSADRAKEAAERLLGGSGGVMRWLRLCVGFRQR